eukprot:TRINITY_DN14004_c0_g1_i1.p1 TRINITY_DN14004_c0_g1~~TRINITY_DN14004_c0_g1_i1.p1  ORF type:complete len:390 (-),score=72.99 TRINITY_DN14004_c0_g1_i1:123-1241(-)
MAFKLSPTAAPFEVEVAASLADSCAAAEPSPFGDLCSPTNSPESAQWPEDLAAEGAYIDAQQSASQEGTPESLLTAYAQADVASKCAADLATHVSYLFGTVLRLQKQVTDLEDWKRRALDEVRKLREEHRTLKKKVLNTVPKGNEEEQTERSYQRSKTLPAPQVSAGPPPGLSPPDASPALSSSVTCRTTSSSSMLSSSAVSSTPGSDVTDGAGAEGIQVSTQRVDGKEFECAEWRIGQLSIKLRGCMGRALVSSPFNAAGLEELRLMVCPDGKDGAKGPRSKRQKELYAKKVLEGPLDGCLKLKVPSCPSDLELKYFLKVGSCRKGPFTHNFSENTVSGCEDFGVDWLTQLDPDLSLLVSVEIEKASPGSN